MKLYIKNICENIFVKTIMVLICALFLNSCGFHTRNYTSNIQMKYIYIKNVNTDDNFLNFFKQKLIANGIKICDQQQYSNYTVEIIKTNFTNTGTNTYSSVQASIFTFFYSAIFRLSDKHNKVLLPDQTIMVSKNLTLNPNEILENSNQVDIVRQELQREVIYRILDIISSHQIIEKAKIQ